MIGTLSCSCGLPSEPISDYEDATCRYYDHAGVSYRLHSAQDSRIFRTWTNTLIKYNKVWIVRTFTLSRCCSSSLRERERISQKVFIFFAKSKVLVCVFFRPFKKKQTWESQLCFSLKGLKKRKLILYSEKGNCCVRHHVFNVGLGNNIFKDVAILAHLISAQTKQIEFYQGWNLPTLRFGLLDSRLFMQRGVLDQIRERGLLVEAKSSRPRDCTQFIIYIYVMQQ